GQDGGDRVAVMRVLDQLLGGLAAHGAGPLQTVLELALRIGEEADGGAPPAAADGGLLEGVSEDHQDAPVGRDRRSTQIGGVHPEAGGDAGTGDRGQARDLGPTVSGVRVDATAHAAAIVLGGRSLRGGTGGEGGAEGPGTESERPTAQEPCA